MYRIGLVDDEAEYIAQLKAAIERYAAACQPPIQLKVDTYDDAIHLISDYQSIYDMIFLDVRMKYSNGMDAAQMIRKLDKNVIIIFLTSFPQYAIQGYKVEASAYLLKPLDATRLKHVLDEAFSKLDRPRDTYFTFRTKEGFTRVLSREIHYCESLSHRIIVHTAAQDIHTWSSMAEIEKQLPAQTFARCNRSYIVNMHHISRFSSSEVLMDNGVRLAIGTTYKNSFASAFMDFIR